MSKQNALSARSSRRSALDGPTSRSELPRTIRFTVDNEDVHEVSLMHENEAAGKVQARTATASNTVYLARSPSDQTTQGQLTRVHPVPTPFSAGKPEEKPFKGVSESLATTTAAVGISMPSQMTQYVSQSQTGESLVPLWQSLLSSLFQAIAENYDIPANMQSKHLRVFVPAPGKQGKSPELAHQYQELVYFDQKARTLMKESSKLSNQHQKLDFSSAVTRFGSESSPRDLPLAISNQVLFVCFTDPDGDSPTSAPPSTSGTGPTELRCPHFRNKCGIKRLVQTSKIGYSTFGSAEAVQAHNLAIHNEYKFKCSAIKCKQRFKTKQQMQNHQGSIHISRSSQSGEQVEHLAFNRNQLADDDEELKEEKPESGGALQLSAQTLSEPPILRQKLKFKCPICPNKQFISKCKLDWHLKCHERQFKCSVEGCDKSFKQKQHLKNHLLTHAEGIRPFRCTYPNCGKAFKSISHLKDHTQSIHMKLKPFECVFCKSLFSRNSSLKYHIRSIHSQLVTAQGELSEVAQQQLQILKESSNQVEQVPEKETSQKRKNARKERVHVKCEIDSSQMATPVDSSSQEKKSPTPKKTQELEQSSTHQGAIGQLHGLLQQAQLQQQSSRLNLQDLLTQASVQQKFILSAPNQFNSEGLAQHQRFQFIQPSSQIKNSPTQPNEQAPVPTYQPLQSASRFAQLLTSPDKPQQLPRSAERVSENSSLTQYQQVLEQIAQNLLQISKRSPSENQNLPKTPLIELQKMLTNPSSNLGGLLFGRVANSQDFQMTAPISEPQALPTYLEMQSMQSRNQPQQYAQQPSLSLSSQPQRGLDQLNFVQGAQTMNFQGLRPQTTSNPEAQAQAGPFNSQYSMQNPVQHQSLTINTSQFNIGGGMGGNLWQPTPQQAQQAVSMLSQRQTAENQASNDFHSASKNSNVNVQMRSDQEQVSIPAQRSQGTVAVPSQRLGMPHDPAQSK